jgi:threonine dehydratase
VLAGIQVAAEQKEEFQLFLDDLGYRYWNESRNPAYNLFLK